VVEGQDLLDGDLTPSWLVKRRSNGTVRALSDGMEELIIVT